MATRKIVKKSVAKKPVAKKTVRATKSAAPAANSSVAHKVVLAGLGAAERAQGEAMKVYGIIARETERLKIGRASCRERVSSPV